MSRAYRRPLDICTKLAATQYGLITRNQALQAGLSRDAIKRLLTEGIWQRVHQGTYALWTPSARSERWRQRLMAGVLWLGKGSAVSHQAAALVWEMDGVKSAPLELSTTGRRRTSGNGLVVYHRGDLPSADIVERHGLPVTSVPRTLVDLASVVEAEVIELALESALRRGLATVVEIKEALRRAPRAQKGKPVLRDLLDRHPGVATGSPLETHFWRLLRVEDMPLPVRQYVIRDPAGRRIARPDFVYPDALLAIEVDGFDSHSRRRDFDRDRAKHNALVRLGWIVYRVTSKDLKQRSAGIVADIAGLLAARQKPTCTRRRPERSPAAPAGLAE
jgi:very-short-patch-repair endonuclease